MDGDSGGMPIQPHFHPSHVSAQAGCLTRRSCVHNLANCLIRRGLCRSTEEMFLSVGARIGYFQGDVRKLVDDIAALRPTLFIGARA